jgi:peptidoglycan hydrolase-like protein with peptidoglycan-binding domain
VRRRRTIAAAVVLTAGIAAGVALATARGSAGEAPAAGDPEPTVPVTRTDLVETQQVDGTLGYAGSAPVVAGRGAMVTWLPQPGDAITRGEHLYDLDNEPVPLLYGRLPFWRELAPGVADGPDVRILEKNLRALGYGRGMTVDDSYTAATAATVRRWQKDRGVRRTGRVAVGDAVVLPGPVRVSEVKATVGTRAAGQVLTVTGTTKQVRVDLPAARSALAVKNGTVTVGLPDGKSAAGKITAVGTVQPVLPVTVALDDPAVTGALDGAPVTVTFQGTRHEGVLAVPVNALLALAEGGFGVQTVAGDGTKTIVPVELGAFANGKVAVRGSGLAAGTKVTVPAA